ncbi:hypothetical protein SAMN04487947_0981 [Halogeometricum rufum]|uniref:DUF7344 domain-containing protein n=2 Tax=Halogeometricum rufum TaxID=553469 RepID=A0A1I6GDT0_9EURY|nr:hypothetical protein SAMN04487947_0981 [Halogeometricum rufum]
MYAEGVPRFEMDDLSQEFGILSQRRRLTALVVLKEFDRPMTLSELVTEVAVRELEVPRDDISDDQHRQIRSSFHHVHLPKLVDADLVQYSTTGEMLRLNDSAATVGRIIDAVFA